MKRAALYMRVSTKNHAQTIETQVRAVNASDLPWYEPSLPKASSSGSARPHPLPKGPADGLILPDRLYRTASRLQIVPS
jgi:hypothetical protein